MEITLDGQAMYIELTTLFILCIPGILYILYIFLYSAKVYHSVQAYIENKYNVKIIFRWRSIRVEGSYSALGKIGIELLYLFLMFLITFLPLIVFAFSYFFLSDAFF